MKVALLGTGFGQAHAAVHATRPDVDEVVVFGRTPATLAKISDQFGFATTADLDALITDASVDPVDICLPTRLHAEVAVRAMQAGKDVLIELPLAATLEDAYRIVAAQQATGCRAFVDMFSRFSPANQQLSLAVADQRYGPLRVLEIEGPTALLWEGYDLSLDTLALDMMHADFDLAELAVGADHHGVVPRRPHRQGIVTSGRQPDRAGRPALMVALPQHPADRGVDVVIDEKAHLPGCGQQPPGLIHISWPQVRERLQDRFLRKPVPQVILHGGHPDPSPREHRGAGMHATALDHLPAVVSRPPRRTLDPRP